MGCRGLLEIHTYSVTSHSGLSEDQNAIECSEKLKKKASVSLM